MFLDRIIIENIGPIDKLDIKLPFNENGNPKPIVFVGENGKGKSTVLSSIVDALFEFAKQSYSDITETNKDGTTPYFKVLSHKNVKVGCGYSFSFLNFKNEEKSVQYIEKVGKLSLEECLQKTDRLLNLHTNWNEESNMKQVSRDENYFRDKFLNKSFCFFSSK